MISLNEHFMFNPSSNTAQFCLADTALSAHSSLTPSLWRGQVFQNAWRGQVFQRLEEREKEKKTFLGEKSFLTFFLFFWLGPNGKWKKKLFRLRKFYFLSPAFNVPDQKKLFFSKQGSAFPLENEKQQPQAWPTATGK